MARTHPHSRLITSFVAFFYATFPGSVHTAWGASHARNRDEVREILKRAWESLGSLEFRCEERALDTAGTQKSGDPVNVFEFKWAPGNRAAMTMARGDVDGSNMVVYERREDGRRRYALNKVPGQPNVTSVMSILSIKSNSDEHIMIMNNLLWILMPGRRPLYTRFDEPGTVVSTNDEESAGVVVAFPHKGGMIRCELDPDHDWLPKRVLLGKDANTSITVDRFARDNGRWFPVQGRHEWLNNPERKQTKFVVTRFAINRPIPERDFGPPPLPEGAVIEDLTVGKTQIVGGVPARQRFVKKYFPAPKAARATEELEGTAGGQGGLSWTIALAAGSVACLIGAFALGRSRNRTCIGPG